MVLPASFPKDTISLALENSDSYNQQLNLYFVDAAANATRGSAVGPSNATSNDAQQATATDGLTPLPTRNVLANMPILSRNEADAKSVVSGPPPYAVNGDDTASVVTSKADGLRSPAASSYIDEAEGWESPPPKAFITTPAQARFSTASSLFFGEVPNPRASSSPASNRSSQAGKHEHSSPPSSSIPGKSLLRKLTGHADSLTRSSSPSPVRQYTWSVELHSNDCTRPLATVRKIVEVKGKATFELLTPPVNPTSSEGFQLHVASLSKGIRDHKVQFPTPWGDWAWKGILHGHHVLRPVEVDKSGNRPNYAYLNFSLNTNARLDILTTCPDVLLAVASAYPLIKTRRSTFVNQFTSQARVEELTRKELRPDPWDTFIATAFNGSKDHNKGKELQSTQTIRSDARPTISAPLSRPPVPEPNASMPEPTASVPEPIASVPEPITSVPYPSTHEPLPNRDLVRSPSDWPSVPQHTPGAIIDHSDTQSHEQTVPPPSSAQLNGEDADARVRPTLPPAMQLSPSSSSSLQARNRRLSARRKPVPT